ncbi:MAG: 30S ribosomal protein S6 [Alphaproteobacteria bacterium]|nr:MAG: 30S ribosomal protein S6 [Alphaproteobacteria bacterium]
MTANTKTVLRNYECVFIFTQDSTEQQVRSHVSEFSQKIKEAGGDVAKTEFCGIRTFAYPIKKMKKGYYVLLNTRMSTDFLKEFEKKLKYDTRLLRHLFVNVETLDPNPSALLQQRQNLDVAYKTQIRSGKVYGKEGSA